jgi:hypothetical protein
MAGFIGKGLGSIKEHANNSVEKLKIESGKGAEIRILTPGDEVISLYEHTVQIGGQWKTITCIGRNDCPLCLTQDKASFKAYLAVLDRADGKVKYWKVSKTVGMQLVGLVEEYGDLSARDFKVTRHGEKLTTTYQFFPRDPNKEDLSKYTLPDIEAIVRPLSKEQIMAIMSGGVSSNSGSDSAPPPAGGSTDYPF